MTPELWIALGVLTLTGVSMLAGLGLAVYRIGRTEGMMTARMDAMEAKLGSKMDAVTQRLDVLNGAVAANTKRSYDNALEIARLQQGRM